MRKKYKGKNGFTLAELLIVVAIIAVLVAISIPIFTTQLEKAREATDLSDVRSAYAEVMTAAITGDGSITYSKDSSQVIRKADGRYSVIVSPLHQEIDDWQSSAELSIGGCLLRIPLIGLENQRQRALVR
ncbi:type IV pilin protein [Blautia sp. Sow4_E7]|uniref:type IV pilin protein n=1 Tax=Blautia sp. Sow4_E7 TaxID=3438749 RepID=UPI003F8DCCFA